MVVLRLVAEGKIAWAFWPPGTDLTAVGSSGGNGIWLTRDADQHPQELDDDDDDDDERGSGDETDEVDSTDEVADEDGDEDENLTSEEGHQNAELKSVAVGRFGVLAIDD